MSDYQDDFETLEYGDGYEDFVKTLYHLFEKRSKNDSDFCKRLWASLTNLDWCNKEKRVVTSFSFRHAGRIIAEMRGEGDYNDWYCCAEPGVPDTEIVAILAEEGWEVF